MASLKCSNCGNGIHYHGLPEDIEYVYCKYTDWKELEPKGFASDELELNNQELFTTAWKCPKCGAFAFFDNKRQTRVTYVYAPAENTPSNFEPEHDLEFGIFFDDYLWDSIQESRVAMTQILNKFSGYYWIIKNENEMFMFSDKEMKHCLAHYKRIKIADK